MNKKKSRRHNPTRSEYAFCWPSPRVLAVKKSHQSEQLLISISQTHYLAKVLPTHVGQQQLFPLILKGGEKKVEIFALHLQHLYLSSRGRAAVLLPETCRENLHSLCLHWLKEQIKKGFFPSFFLFWKGFAIDPIISSSAPFLVVQSVLSRICFPRNDLTGDFPELRWNYE